MTDALIDLRQKWGLADSDIARALHTNIIVIRHWRNGVEPSADEVARADLLNDFLTDVHAAGIAEPGAWLAEPFVDGYTVTRWQLYVADQLYKLRLNASGELPDIDMLTAIDPDWRRTYWTSFTTVEAGDGGMSIVGKTYDEVLRQVGR